MHCCFFGNSFHFSVLKRGVAGLKNQTKPNQSSVPCFHCSQIPQGLKDTLAWQLAQSKAEQTPDKQRALGMETEKPGSMKWEN